MGYKDTKFGIENTSVFMMFLFVNANNRVLAAAESNGFGVLDSMDAMLLVDAVE